MSVTEMTEAAESQPQVEMYKSDGAATEEQVGALLPVVIVADRSWSMKGEQIQVVNNELEKLRLGLLKHPVAGAITRIAVVSFSTTATVEVDMAEPVKIGTMPTLDADGSTSYAAACDLLTAKLPQWINQLKYGPGAEHKTQKIAVYRPTVFWLTDGAPTDEEHLWRGAVERLTDPTNPWAPNIVAFGLGAADPEVISTLARRRGKAFMAQRGQNVDSCLAAIVPAILNSLVTSASAVATATTGGPATIAAPIPTTVPGMIPLDTI